MIRHAQGQRPGESDGAQALEADAKANPDAKVFSLDQSQGRTAGPATGNLAAIKCNSMRRYSKEEKRWMLGGERILCHGLPVCDWSAKALDVEIRKGVLELSNSDQSVIAGNGMVLICVLGSLVLACTAFDD